MRFNVSAEDAKFFIDEEDKVVVCVIEKTKRLFLDFATDNFRINPMCDESFSWRNSIKSDHNLAHKLLMPDRFVGIARCGADDEFDEDVGCAIAFSRAKDNLLRSFFKRATTYVNTIDKWLNDSVDLVNELGAKLTVNTEKRHSYINSLLGEE